MRLRLLSLLLASGLAAELVAQQTPAGGRITPAGPLISSGGMSALVPDATFPIPTGHLFRVVWEINVGSDSAQNAQLGTLARFYNLHARHGIPTARLKAAAVVHGTGWISLLTDAAHAARYGTPNPSRRLVEELIAQGAQLVVCGQTAAFRGVQREELLPGVQLAISAMTALNVFASQGYQLNPWR
jgi:intracellular sulfur oxidation DsrE/DsrF family protein